VKRFGGTIYASSATRSRPFDKPSTGKIAIKVINHYGDQLLNDGLVA
jgi:hypothetical protein